MNRYFSALAATVAAACLGGAAQANEGTTYYYTDDTTVPYSDRVAPSLRSYESPAIDTPAPQVYYAPVYTQRPNTTYYYSGSNHDGYVHSQPGYTTYYERRVIYPSAPATTYYYSQPTYVAPPQPYGYVPPGLSISTPTGIYAPFYGGWNSYSPESDGYRIGR